MEQRKQVMSQYINSQKLNGLKGPLQTFNYRLCSSMLFYNEREKFHLIQKIVNATEALNFEDHSDIITANYKLYLRKLQDLGFSLAEQVEIQPGNKTIQHNAVFIVLPEKLVNLTGKRFIINAGRSVAFLPHCFSV